MSELSNTGTATHPNVTGDAATHMVTMTVEEKMRREQGEHAFGLWKSQTGFLLGKVLTVVDAAFTDREQRKAVKDLIRAQFHAQTKHVCNITTGGNLVSGPDGEVEV